MSKSSIKNTILYHIKQRTRENPIRSKEISYKLGCSDVHIRDAVHELRTKDNIPVCSGGRGYYFPTDISEARHSINHLRSRARKMMDAAKGMEEHYMKEEQTSLI